MKKLNIFIVILFISPAKFMMLPFTLLDGYPSACVLLSFLTGNEAEEAVTASHLLLNL